LCARTRCSSPARLHRRRAKRAHYIHRGIAGRAFERRFGLADHLAVQGARIENGLLHVALKREVPEALKPRRITIDAGSPRQAIEQAS